MVCTIKEVFGDVLNTAFSMPTEVVESHYIYVKKTLKITLDFIEIKCV